MLPKPSLEVNFLTQFAARPTSLAYAPKEAEINLPTKFSFS